MPRMIPAPGSDKERPLKSEADTQRYTPTPRRNPRAAPEAGIFEEPTRCLKINLEWWSHISGMIDTLSSEELWTGDAEEQARALRQIAALLAYNECGGFDVTPEELENAIHAGMYRVINDVAAQIKSGVTGGFTIGEDGTVSFPTTGGADSEGLPADDPATQINETESARYGGVVEVGKNFELLLDKVDGYYGPINASPVTSATDTKNFINSYFKTDIALMDAAIDAYFTWRGTNNRILFDGSAAFYQFLYCNGHDSKAIAQYFIDAGLAGYTTQKQQIVINLAFGLTAENYEDNYLSGIKKPSNAYLDASCVKIADQTLTGMLFAVARNTTPLKANHRMLFIADGYALDVDGDIQDWFWYRTAAGVNTFTTPTFTHSAGTNLPSQNQVVYNAGHHYEWTIDLQNLNNFMTITLNKHANMNAAGLDYPTPFSLTIKDLGEVTA